MGAVVADCDLECEEKRMGQLQAVEKLGSDVVNQGGVAV
jgi:hypothetical protein